MFAIFFCACVLLAVLLVEEVDFRIMVRREFCGDSFGEVVAQSYRFMCNNFTALMGSGDL